MDCESDRATLPEERCEVYNDPFKTSKKTSIVALKRKMDGFENQLTTIRARLEARRELASPRRDFHLPAVNSIPNMTSETAGTSSSSLGRLKLPLLRRIDGTRVANAPPQDPFLEVENVVHRTMTRELYVRDANVVTVKELAAASAAEDAQQLGEEARKRMVAYTQHESGWRFEERTSRYQQVMEMKQRAEQAQQEADLQRDTVRQMKALLRDPYKELRSCPGPRSELTPLASGQDEPFRHQKEYEWIWILASPSTKLTFTPREETPNNVIEREKELSMYVVYYIAASDVNTRRVETAEQWQDALTNDCPPTSGWMGCSVHGVPPAPELVSVRSGIQTWTVAGAGAGHLNGKYVACGVHDNARRFKSSAGVELFRKCVPVESSLAQVLHGGRTARPESASSSVIGDDSRGNEGSLRSRKKAKPSVVLPSGLAAIAKDELDFRSMQRVGSWLSMNESIERHRRMLASRSASDDSAALKLDGNSVMNQKSRQVEDASDVVESRPVISASLCREWVLFARCSKLRGDKATSGASEPPIKGVGLGCLKRHYYISFEEKREMTVWTQTKESWLEKNVLSVIIEREAQLERVSHLSRKCTVKFQQNLRAETDKSKLKLLVELNRVRFLTVKVFETIDRWRQHARKIGFVRIDNPVKRKKGTKHNVAMLDKDLSDKKVSQQETEAPLLGWSSSITLDTGKQLYKRSKAFVSMVKRFRRSEDVTGKREQHIVYLGYFETQEEAERAYDEHAASEARRLNTTVEHLPRRRNVFRSCGKHFAVESEKDGPSFCIECKTKQLASISSTSADEWIPPFFYGTGVNYIMKMANDLDFLDDVLPLKAALNCCRGVDQQIFPLRGNIFLLPKTPIQDPDLAVFTTFLTPTAPRLGESLDGPSVNDIDDEALDRERIFKAQQMFLQELQIYRPELISDSQNATKPRSTKKVNEESPSPHYRLVEALYWDHCAALKIQQERAPLALRQDNIWCRPDAGEWASLVVRGAHQLHFLFEEKLEKAGKEMVQRRQQVLAALRQLNKIPLYFVPSRSNFTELIAAGQQVRGDVVQLEVNNATKRLQRYDSWCTMSLVVQRWFRGVLGRQKARAARKALRFAYKLRVFYAKRVAAVAESFYEAQVHAVAVRKAYKAICTPIYTRSVMMDGELVIVTFHSLRHYQLYHGDFHNTSASKRSVIPSGCCASCARRHHVKAHYQSHQSKFSVFRGVCTCSVCGGSSQEGDMANESWLIRAYSPSHNVIYRLRLESPQLEQLLSSRTQSQLSLFANYRPLVMDMEATKLAAAVASRCATFCFQNAENAANTLMNWRRMNSEATQTRKSLMVALEKSLLLLDSTKYAHGVSVINAKKALDFASRPFSEAQAWDPLENANDWRFIVEKRQLVKRLEETHQEVERLRVAYFQATYNEQYARAGAVHAQEEYNRFWIPIVERESQAMEEAILLETTAKTRMESFMEQLCDRLLTLRDGYLAPTRRSLVVQSPLWHDMVPFRLDIPGLRRRLNCLRRRTLVLSNLAKQNKRTRRMIVSVSMWPLIARSSKHAQTNRDLWVTAYDPVDCSMHNIFLEWELVQLLTGAQGRKIWQDVSESKRSAWRSIAEILLSLTMLDRFTGEFTLQKLQFYHTLRRLSPQFLSSRVMRDLQAGRKCGQGDEVLRQAVSVDGKLCVVVVYENWGDLTFAIYHTASGEFFRLVMPLHVVFDLLDSKPLMLRLWISCVKSNSYASTLLVYLLKHVRFYKCENGSENARIEDELPAQKRSKRYQALVRIQNRQVFVSIIEDSAGDFQISGYDVRRELIYKLTLERDGLHRILKTSVFPDDSGTGNPLATSASSLLLRRNRKELYEWICSRLRFQSMLEHPELITSGTSPLVLGLHLRESFRILNGWIGTSPRNPLHAVSETEITRRASSIDAAAFSSLQFDQLTLVAHQQLPFELEKQYVGTMDWVEAVAGTSSSSWKKQLPHMKMDLFVRSHTLFARLRGELEAEAKERRKRETWAGMEQEDRNALCIDTFDLINVATKYISWTTEKLFDLNAAARKRLEQWQQVHSELKVATKSTDMRRTDTAMPATLAGAHMLKEDNILVFLDFLNLWLPTTKTDLLEFILLAVPLQSCSPLAAASTILHACLERVELELKTTLSKLEVAFETLKRSEGGLEDLRIHKGRILHFYNLLARQPTTSTNIEETENETLETNADLKVEHDGTGNASAISTESATANVVNSGLLIPSNNNEPIQEVFLSDLPTWAPSAKSPFVAHAQYLVKHLRPFFQQQWRQQQLPGSRSGRRASNATGVLTCRRVAYGVIVYQAVERDLYSKTQISQMNARAVALTGGIFVCGPVLFWPLLDGNEWFQRLIDSDAIHRELTRNSEDVELEDVVLKRPAAVRSTKYLPWKQFAIERLRIARAVKCSRTAEGVSVDSLVDDSDQVEKDKRTITTISVGFRQLELSLGVRDSRELRGDGNVTKAMKHFFALHEDDESSDRSKRWRVSLSNPRMLHNVLEIHNQDGRAIQIPAIGREDKDTFKMQGIQVEVDDVDKPRRLLFSCRELQTQRRYFVDCDFHSLQCLLLQRSYHAETSEPLLLASLQAEVKWRRRSVAMTIQDWRKLAALAAQFLVFRRKNGALSLCLELFTPELQMQEDTDKAETVPAEESEAEEVGYKPQESSAEHKVADEKSTQQLEGVGVHNNEVCIETALPPLLPRRRQCRAETLEEQRAVKRSLVQHFQKHQPAIRAAACGRTLATTSHLGSRIASEWMQMTQEDWSSQELRGMLTLDSNVLNKLEKAYTPATRRAREYLKVSTKEDDTGGLELQLKEIVKAMGQTAFQPDEVELLQSIRMIRWRRRGKKASAAAKRAEAYLADIAEWWRRRLTTMQSEMK